jgi:ribosomal protein RSM22 (predicted rRNA methylase)
MQMPFKLISKIESLIDGLSLNDIALARKELTRLYRGRDYNQFFNPLASDEERLAYLVARLPATYAVVCQVFFEIQKRCGGEPIDSLLDIGAGPGTVLLAAREVLPPLAMATLMERDRGFIKLGKELTEEQNWICHDFTKDLPLLPHDLVVASYSLGELCEKERIEVLGKLWELTKKFLVIIEPGTKTAFESLKKMREVLLLNGGHLVAPCPHFEKCPMKEKDWCHFSARIERSSLHRKIKDGTLNYEDEKFSYLIFSKNKVAPCQTRVVRHPFKGAGFIKLQLCSKNGIEEKTVTKKTKLQFSYARKIKWGDEFFINELHN